MKNGRRHVVAAILTIALCSTKPRAASGKAAEGQWRSVWRDYNKFVKALEAKDKSIDARGINPH